MDNDGTPQDQTGLQIQAEDTDPIITVDDLEVAQFVYLLLNNAKIRSAIVVLILGRFTDDRKSVLDALRDELAKR
jgi:hypothetical protein